MVNSLGFGQDSLCFQTRRTYLHILLSCLVLFPLWITYTSHVRFCGCFSLIFPYYSSSSWIGQTFTRFETFTNITIYQIKLFISGVASCPWSAIDFYRATSMQLSMPNQICTILNLFIKTGNNYSLQ